MANKDNKKKLGQVVLEDGDSAKSAKKPSDNITDKHQQQIAGLTDALQRERADALNLRRQYEDQLASLQSVSKANVVKDLLPVVDDLERAIKHIPADLKDNEFVIGVKKIIEKFEKSFASIGVERIKTVGQPFDPNFHEAVSMEQGDGEQEIVTEELQSGYKLGDNVIRHAMVRVKG